MPNVSREKCEWCKTSKNVDTVIDPWEWEVNQKKVQITLCSDCLEIRRDDI